MHYWLFVPFNVVCSSGVARWAHVLQDLGHYRKDMY
jgi:hypothetical protein